MVEKPEEDCSIKSSGNSQGTSSGHSELEVEELDEGCASDSKGFSFCVLFSNILNLLSIFCSASNAYYAFI